MCRCVDLDQSMNVDAVCSLWHKISQQGFATKLVMEALGDLVDFVCLVDL